MEGAVKNLAELKRERRYLKSLFFVMFLAFGSISPFATIFFKRILTNPDGTPAIHLIGIMIATAPIVGFFANITVGVLSDKFGLSRKLITLLSFAGAAIALILGFFGTHSMSYIPLEQKFVLLFLASLVYNFVIVSLEPLITSETLQHLGKHSDRNKFGTIRIWGTYGWAVAALLMGIMVTFVSAGNGEAYRFVYYSGALAMFCLGVLGIKAKTLVERKPKISYKHILKDTLFMRFLFFVFIEGTVRTMTTGGYLSYFFDDVMETPLQIGMIYCFWTAFEIPVLANSDKLLKKFGSKKLFIAGFVAIIIQLYLFSLFTAEMPFAFKFAATLIHGLSFSLNYIALMDYLDRYAHKDMKTSYLAAKNISRTTLATVVGGALGGIIIANFGATMLMRGGAVAMVFMAIFFLLFVKSPTEK